ncbi:tetratricopeptide repeat protein [Billgrantia diversa]|uniref:YfgM family protein n=1 Tax=Halomonas sp. MCCC 1A13316 TaxID=2733487 RepID=UPI0018A683A0|nr:tetratricopeptide repeat protein [Halomonas sp. MCCC 1A13316]QOR40123.1 tetratricopeptide repeat protein [Halomonas sp. MCCC 1A13316]
MAELRTEEEQLEAIKRWWKENGTSLIAGVAIAIAGVVGWNAWQSYQDNQAQAASMRYQQVVNLVDSEETDEARGLIAEITDDHGGTLYADLARLIDARLAVDEGELDKAREILDGVIASSKREYVQGLARLRLARLQVATNDAEAALDTLARDVPAALTAQQADVRGDALHALGRDDEARQAWQEALAVAEQRNQPIYGVQLKLDDLGAEEAML